MSGKYRAPHFHMEVFQEGMVCYSYTDYLPTDSIVQFSTLAALIDGADFKEMSKDVAWHFLELHHKRQYPFCIVNGEFMAEAVYKCDKPCYISPAMN